MDRPPPTFDLPWPSLATMERNSLNVLAVRASMQAGAAHSAFDPVPAAISEALVASYDAQRNNIGRADVSAPATWMAAKAWFGNDVQFIMKLVGRQVSAPSHRFPARRRGRAWCGYRPTEGTLRTRRKSRPRRCREEGFRKADRTGRRALRRRCQRIEAA